MKNMYLQISLDPQNFRPEPRTNKVYLEGYAVFKGSLLHAIEKCFVEERTLIFCQLL